MVQLPAPKRHPATRPRRTPLGLLFAMLCAGGGIVALLLTHDPPQWAHAAPYTVRHVAHPLDPDWPDIYLVLSAKCAACHRPGQERSDLSSYEALVSDQPGHEGPLVVPGSTADSPLWDYVRWNHAADPESDEPAEPQMPPDENEWLTAGQLAVVRRWIENGALKYALPPGCGPRPLLEIDFPAAKECRTCHPKQYEEWSRSMHAYAQHSPIVEAFNLSLLERTNGTLGTFCTRCHTPLGTALGENGLRRNVNRSRLSMEGITCVVCHRPTGVHYKGNSRFDIPAGKLLDRCVMGPFEDPVAAAAGAHPARGAPHIKTAAFCGSCHDVTTPAGVRLEEAFSEWQNSPAARQGITCQQCHMGPVPGVPIPDEQRPWGRAATVPDVDPELIPLRPLSDHTFAGPDYSLLPDTEFPQKLDWMYEVDYRDTSRLTPHQARTLDNLRRRNRAQLGIANRRRYELLHNAARISSVTAPHRTTAAGRIRVRVEITSLFAGHNFPTGFSAERQAWVEVTLLDPRGRAVFRSGDLDTNGDLRDEHSHEVAAGKLPYDRHLLNFQSRFVALTNKGTERPVVLSVNRHLDPLSFVRPAGDIAASFGRPEGFRVSKGSLPPLATMGQNYDIRLPDVAGDYRLLVRLNFRHLPPVLLDEIGAAHLKHLLEVVVIDQQRRVIRVVPREQQVMILGKP